MKLFTTNKSRILNLSILFNGKTLKHIFFTKKREMWDGLLKTPNACVFNLKPRWIR